MRREYTIGEIARIINVARSTVINWIKKGKMDAFQLPGGNNRVTRDNLILFMEQYGIPLDFLDNSTKKRILLVSNDKTVINSVTRKYSQADKYVLEFATSIFDTGLKSREIRPHLIIVDLALPDVSGKDLSNSIKLDRELKATLLLGINSPSAQGSMSEGFDAIMTMPFQIKAMIELVTRLLG